MEYTHGIPGNILKGQFHSPNGGLSATCWNVTIVGPEVDAVKLRASHLRPIRPDAPAVRIGRTLPTYIVLHPAAELAEGHTSYMASGAWVTVSGGSLYADAWFSLFGTYGPVPLHDRSELYDRSETYGLHNILAT